MVEEEDIPTTQAPNINEYIRKKSKIGKSQISPEEQDEMQRLSMALGKRDASARATSAMAKYYASIQKYSMTEEEKRKKTVEEVEEQIRHFEKVIKVPWFLLMPDSKYMQKWDIVTMFALVFTALVTPYEVALLTTKIDGLFFVNRGIDIIFVKDMIMQFFLAFRLSTREGGRRLVKNLKEIRSNYLSGWFAIDLISVLPFDLFALGGGGPEFLTRLKLLRVIRLLRLLKLARVIRSSRIFKRLESRIALSYSVQGLIKFVIILLIFGHWLACAWILEAKMTIEEAEDNALLEDDTGRINRVYCADDDGGHPLAAAIGLESAATLTPTAAPTSWNAAEYKARLPYRDDCYSRPSIKSTWLDSLCAPGGDTCAYHHHTSVYTAAIYWSIVTITSVGYGDITPQNPSEMRWCTFLLLMGAFLWAYIIGNACGIVSTLDVDNIEHRQRMDQLNIFMDDQGFPLELKLKLRRFFNESKLMAKEEAYATLMDRMSPQLEAEVIIKKCAWMNSVPYLRDHPQEFVVAFCRSLYSKLYIPQEQIMGVSGERLATVLRGIVSRQGRVMTPGTCWGEDFILATDSLKDYRTCLSLTYVELLSIGREDFFALLGQFPDSAEVVRKAIVRMTFYRGVLKVARAIRLRDSEDLCRLMKDSSAAASALMDIHNDQDVIDDDDEGGMFRTSSKLPPLKGAEAKKLMKRIESLEATLTQRIEGKIDAKFDELVALIRQKGL